MSHFLINDLMRLMNIMYLRFKYKQTISTKLEIFNFLEVVSASASLDNKNLYNVVFEGTPQIRAFELHGRCTVSIKLLEVNVVYFKQTFIPVSTFHRYISNYHVTTTETFEVLHGYGEYEKILIMSSLKLLWLESF